MLSKLVVFDVFDPFGLHGLRDAMRWPCKLILFPLREANTPCTVHTCHCHAELSRRRNGNRTLYGHSKGCDDIKAS